MSSIHEPYDELSLNSPVMPMKRRSVTEVSGSQISSHSTKHSPQSVPGDELALEQLVVSSSKFSLSQNEKLRFALPLGGIKVSLFILCATFIVGAVLLFTPDKEAQAYSGVAATEKKIDKAVTSGGETEALYLQLLEKERHLDSLLKVSGSNKAKEYQDTVDYFIDAVMTEFYDDNYTLPPALRNQIKKHVKSFTRGSGKKGMQKVISRRDIYFPYVQQVFAENRVPDVLKYVAMQESLLNPTAKSHVGAAGLWQFMPRTARGYGLEVSGDIDERYEWQKATVSAALYFRRLLSLFGKGDGVLLAIASYNAGEGKIQRALSKVEDPLLNRNFGYLYRTSTLLAKETREYVPKILARAIVDQNRVYYGFR